MCVCVCVCVCVCLCLCGRARMCVHAYACVWGWGGVLVCTSPSFRRFMPPHIGPSPSGCESLMMSEAHPNNVMVSQAHPLCCHDWSDAARHGHVACLQLLQEEGTFLGFHDPEREQAGETRKTQAWLAALAACDARQPAVLRWLFAGGWPLADSERLWWHFRDMADPSMLTWYTGERPCIFNMPKGRNRTRFRRRPDGTVIDWQGQSEWAEMATLAGFVDPPSVMADLEISGRIYGKSGACGEWFPQEFQVLWRACKSGDLACQQVIVEAGCRSRWVSVLAALTGQLPFLQFAIEQGCPCEGSILVAAAAGGHLDSFDHVLKMCVDNVGKVPLHVARDVTSVGNPDCSPDLFFSTRFKLDYRRRGHTLVGDKDFDTTLDAWFLKAAIAAAENDHLEVLKHVLKHVMAWDGEIIKRKAGWANPASAAVWHGRLQCLEYAHIQGCIPGPRHVGLAMETGHTACIKYVLSHNLQVPVNFSRLVAKAGDLELLELCMGRDTQFGNAASFGALEGGHLACLRFALEKGNCDFPDDLLREAAEKGSVSCMRYLHEKGYAAAESTLYYAARSCSLPCLDFAFEIGCEPDEFVMEEAASQDVSLVRYLHERDCPWGEATTEEAAQRGCLTTLQYCHEHGCPWHHEVIQAAMESAACLQYIHTHDCPPLPDPCPPAYNLKVLQYAVDNMGDWGKKVLQATSRYLLEDDQHQFADWRLLMYLAQKKVALAPVLQRAVDARIARFEAVVRCFHLATRLAGHGGPHAPMWAAMGKVPQVMVEQITKLANLRL